MAVMPLMHDCHNVYYEFYKMGQLKLPTNSRLLKAIFVKFEDVQVLELWLLKFKGFQDVQGSMRTLHQ